MKANVNDHNGDIVNVPSAAVFVFYDCQRDCFRLATAQSETNSDTQRFIEKNRTNQRKEPVGLLNTQVALDAL